MLMNNTPKIFASLIFLSLLGACATAPTGPSVLALPGTGKSVDQFKNDDLECRHFAATQIGAGTVSSSGSDNAGRRSAAAGTGAEGESPSDMQQHYDFAYEQCMYAKGQRIPVWGNYSSNPSLQQGGDMSAPSAPSPALPQAR
jgi:hypothetical protein